MIHPRKYEEYELGVLVIHAKHDQKLGLWVEVSVSTQNGMCNDINVGKYLEMHTKMRLEGLPWGSSG